MERDFRGFAWYVKTLFILENEKCVYGNVQVHGRFVNSIQFEYTSSGGPKEIVTFGALNDPLPTDSVDTFVLRDNERLEEVRGRMGNYVDAIEFVLSSGRTFGEYGSQNIDHGTPFSYRDERGRAILGLGVTGSVRGWLRSVDGVMFSIPNMNAAPRSNLDVLNQHRKRLKTIWQSIWYLVIAMCVLVLYFTRSFLVTSSLCSLKLPSEFSVVRKFKPFSEPRIGNMFPRMVRYVSIRDDDNEILVIKQHAYDNTQTLEGGYVRDFDAVRIHTSANITHAALKSQSMQVQRPQVKQLYPKKKFYIDTTGNAYRISIAMVLCAIGFLSRALYVVILKGIDPFRKSLENVTSVSSIETEINSDNCTVIRLRHNLIVITPNFLLKLGAFRVHTVAIRDIILPERPSYIRTWVNGERVDVVNLKIVSRRFLNTTFHISILREQYRQLESFVSRIRSAQAAIAKQRSSVFLTRFVQELKRRQDEGTVATTTSASTAECLGACGHNANVKIVKRCQSCTEREPCLCAPSWCHRCILKWWISQNQTKLEMELPIDPRWQARCPTCRAYFCLDDILPCSGAVIFENVDSDDEEEEN